ncbi:MAG: DUF3592 domain-containing protein [Pseudomonadota bacterium]
MPQLAINSGSCHARLDSKGGLIFDWRQLIEASGALVFFGLGAWLLLASLLPSLVHWARDYSEAVPAQVVESRMKRRSGPWGPLRWEPVFRYRYFHEGQLFVGSAYRPDGGLAQAVQYHPPGTMLTAYVDAQDPRFAMIWPDMSADRLGRMLFGFLLLFAAVASFYRSMESETQS